MAPAVTLLAFETKLAFFELSLEEFADTGAGYTFLVGSRVIVTNLRAPLT